jgi:hypothetical protein
MVEVPKPTYRAEFGMMARLFAEVVAHLELGVVCEAHPAPVPVICPVIETWRQFVAV